MKTFEMIVLIFLSLPSSSSATPWDRTFVVKNNVFMGTKVPEFCWDYFQSSSSKLKDENINPVVVDRTLFGKNELIKQEEYYLLQSSIQNLAEQKYADHICDASEFAPTVLSADYQLTCLEICQRCMPGSASICFLRSPRYAGLAQVCLCTYDLQNPVENAAFSLRHEKRVFSRKIRRT